MNQSLIPLSNSHETNLCSQSKRLYILVTLRVNKKCLQCYQSSINPWGRFPQNQLHHGEALIMIQIGWFHHFMELVPSQLRHRERKFRQRHGSLNPKTGCGYALNDVLEKCVRSVHRFHRLYRPSLVFTGQCENSEKISIVTFTVFTVRSRLNGVRSRLFHGFSRMIFFTAMM